MATSKTGDYANEANITLPTAVNGMSWGDNTEIKDPFTYWPWAVQRLHFFQNFLFAYDYVGANATFLMCS